MSLSDSIVRESSDYRLIPVEMPMASPADHAVPDARVCAQPMPAVTCAAAAMQKNKVGLVDKK